MANPYRSVSESRAMILASSIYDFDLRCGVDRTRCEAKREEPKPTTTSLGRRARLLVAFTLGLGASSIAWSALIEHSVMTTIIPASHRSVPAHGLIASPPETANAAVIKLTLAREWIERNDPAMDESFARLLGTDRARDSWREYREALLPLLRSGKAGEAFLRVERGGRAYFLDVRWPARES